jgi:CBS domain containing-hemolysin-like protein
VYGESLDDIVGTVHAKEVLRALRAGGHGTVQSVLRPPLFVPGSREIEDVLADMKRQKVHLAIVLDEYGGTAGLVTMEDLLEEIVGQIYDEYDRPAESPAAGAAPVLDGATEVKDVNATYSLQLPAADYNTVGGLVFGTLGRLPKVGDRVTVGTVTFEVIEMAGRRVSKVRALAGIDGSGTTGHQ